MERRVRERVKVLFSVMIEPCGQDQPIRGEIINISGTGACVAASCAREKDEAITLRVDVRQDRYLKDKLQQVVARARVMWKSAPSDIRYPFRYGVQFDQADQANIAVLIKELETEQTKLSCRDWSESHPCVGFSTVELSSELLKGLHPSALSVDVTNLCNLRCAHCFWDYSKGELPPTTNEHIIDSVKEVLAQYPSITNIVWYGGEPLLNAQTRALVEEGIALKKNNLVITNGTFSLPDWKKNAHFRISIDGTEYVHNQLRGGNIYAGIKQNIFSGIERDLRIFLLYCVNTVNMDCMEDAVKEWADTGVIDIAFTFYVPLKAKASYLELSAEQMEEVSMKLVRLENQYGDFICNTKKMIELLRPQYGEELAKNCPMNVFNRQKSASCLHLCNDGTVRIPCAFGHDADHVRCRSITKLALYAAQTWRDKESYIRLLRMFHSRPLNMKRKDSA